MNHRFITGKAAFIDSMIDFDASAGRTIHRSPDATFAYVRSERLTVTLLWKTHAHSDNLAVTPRLKGRAVWAQAAGRGSVSVQKTFGRFFNASENIVLESVRLNRLPANCNPFTVGGMDVAAHYVVDENRQKWRTCSATAFSPTARSECRTLALRKPICLTARHATFFRAIHRLRSSPRKNRGFDVYDFKTTWRDSHVRVATISAERANGERVPDDVWGDDFEGVRCLRDAMLHQPRLIRVSIGLNAQGSRLLPGQDTCTRYRDLPLDAR